MRTKLLLADDSITIQKVVGIIFASEDYDLAIVDSGSAVLDKAKEFKPDLLLVDAVMPDKSGYDVCEDIRRDQDLKGVPILLLTGAFEPFDEEKARECGADDFISKPFESQHLIDKVSDLVDLGRQRMLAAPTPFPSAGVPDNEGLLEAELPASAASFQSTVPEPPPLSVPQSTASPTVSAADAEPATLTGSELPPATTDFAYELVEGTAEDDLWGAFDLEELAEGDTAAFPESSLGDEPFDSAPDTAGEVFDFAADIGGGTEPAAGSTDEYAVEWEAEADAGFAFPDEEPTEFDSVYAGQEEPAGAGDELPVHDLVDIKPYAPPSEQEFDLQFDGEEEHKAIPETLQFTDTPQMPLSGGEADYSFAMPDEPLTGFNPPASVEASGTFGSFPAREGAEPIGAPEQFVSAPETLSRAAATAPSATSLTDEQIENLVARISRDIIEKIAWEVVPDLAETIIKEEIRKIKEGV